MVTAFPGNRELLWQIGLNMDLDPASLETREGFKEFLYLSQVYQAVSLKTETETYRWIWAPAWHRISRCSGEAWWRLTRSPGRG